MSDEGLTPAVYYSSLLGLASTVSSLLHAGADVHSCTVLTSKGTAFHAALRETHLNIAHILLQAGADVDYNSSERPMPLLAAANSGPVRPLQFLIQAGANVNAVQQGGYYRRITALHFACRDYGSKEGPSIGDLLISAGADIEARTHGNSDQVHDGDTTLHVASRNEALQMTSLLLSKGADVNAINTSSETPLSLAVGHDDEEMVRALLAGGAEITVIHLELAVSQGSSSIVEVLLEGGADLEAWKKLHPSAPSIQDEVVESKDQIRKRHLEQKERRRLALLSPKHRRRA